VVIDDVLYYLHPASRDLSLAEGVALIRLLLVRINAGDVPCAVNGALDFRRAERIVVRGGRGAAGGVAVRSLAGVETADGTRHSTARGASGASRSSAECECSKDAECPPESSYWLLSPAGSVGDDGEDDSPETLIQQIAVALSEGGGFKIPF
jgi:hypothetical protein